MHNFLLNKKCQKENNENIKLFTHFFVLKMSQNLQTLHFLTINNLKVIAKKKSPNPLLCLYKLVKKVQIESAEKKCMKPLFSKCYK